MIDKKSSKSRRKLLKSIAVGSGAIVAGKSLPDSWRRPVVESVVLPAHAQTSAPPITGPGSMIFNFTGSEQTFTVPAGVTSVSITALGAQGGVSGNGDVGAQGGSATGSLAVSAGETLFVYVGGAGTPGSGGVSCGIGGGFNGGGPTGATCCGNSGSGAGSGGGASDVRQGANALGNRVIVAGGGGGGGSGDAGGAGGGATGADGGTFNGITATGGTQAVGGTAGGTFGAGCSAGTDGSLGQGGMGDGNDGGGAGGGYYGGGGGSNNGGGAGGSGYTGGVSGGSMNTGSQPGNGQVTITWI